MAANMAAKSLNNWLLNLFFKAAHWSYIQESCLQDKEKETSIHPIST